MNNRILYSDNGTLHDFSVDLNNYYNSPKSLILKTTDYLYIGARLPFNHIYIKVLESNKNSSKLSIEYWTSEGWASCVEVLDSTNGLSRTGFLEWTPDRQTSWAMESTNDEGQSVDGLTSVKIYDKFWVRIKTDVSFSNDCEIDWIGNLFSNDDDLGSEYPDLIRGEVKTSFKAGKVNWEEQSVRAAEIIIQDLIDKNVIKEKGQILNWRDFTNASVHKVAEIIFNSFGDDYRDNSADARKEYLQRISKSIYRVDLNKNAIEDVKESFNNSGFLSR
jgi:hypothetical protein